MDLTLCNKAMQPISGFAIQLNKNSFGVTPAAPLNVAAPLAPNQSIDVSLSLSTNGPVQRMDPLTNLQVSFCPGAYTSFTYVSVFSFTCGTKDTCMSSFFFLLFTPFFLGQG